MFHYLWWIPAAITLYMFYAWMSKQSQELGGVYFWLLLAVPTPLWALVTKVSKNILIDGIVYDLAMLLGFSSGCVILGVSSGFAIHQYAGLGLAISGIILMKI